MLHIEKCSCTCKMYLIVMIIVNFVQNNIKKLEVSNFVLGKRYDPYKIRKIYLDRPGHVNMQNLE